jgi:cobyrinic acid a,c-diamide synthase
MASVLGPRLVVAGTRSGAGKTTVATGLMAALRRRGRKVAPAKVGPDFIDPGYHSLATGRPGRNLDLWMSGRDAIAPLAARAAAGADLLVIEGVMGLFDGAADGTPSSTAEVAKLLGAPVVLVVDAASMSQSVAALIHGYRTWDPEVTVAGVILNLVGSDNHEAMLRDALEPTGMPVLGVLRKDDTFAWRSRHLGLLPVVEHPEQVAASLDRLAAAIEARCDLEALERLAGSAPGLPASALVEPARVGSARIAVAGGPAFSFCYQANLEALQAAGAEILPFDPCGDPALPEGTQAVLAGGGFPEVFADALSDNRSLLADLRTRHAQGVPIWAECGGLLWLTQSLDGRPMAGIIEAKSELTGRRVLGYRAATTAVATPLGPAGTELRGHEFHYSATDPDGTALTLVGRQGTSQGGFGGARLLACYLHVHLGAEPALAERFVRAAAG